MNYEAHIRAQINEFISTLKTEFHDACDWIDALDSNASIGLDHLDKYEEVKQLFNQNPFEVSIGISMVGLTQEDIDELDTSIREFAEQQGVSVSMTEASGEVTVYTFYLHGKFLDAPN